jgi:meso-butanediol dehydrogenase / (S,S)-butanediol dehydrogenase / diacetyl reductase
MMASRLDLHGRVAVVTGAASGIGFACAQLLLSRGASVALFDVNAAQGAARANQLGPAAAFFPTDVASEESVAASIASVRERFARIDILVNCAAIQIMGTLLETAGEQWDRLQQVNLKGVFLCSKAAMPLLQASGAGAIVNISSILGIVADPDLAAYGAMKGGVIALTRSMAIGYGPTGVRVNCICPGDVNTPMVAAYFDNAPDPAALRAEVNSKYALRRIADPAEIAEVVAFLASDSASFMTGSILVVDGGLTSKCY